MNANAEHARYAFVESAKAAALDEISEGMSRVTVDQIIAGHISGLGKQARASLRSACYTKAGLATPASHEDKGRLIKSARGTWAIAIDQTAAALTHAECIARNLTPGPGND